MTFTPLHQALGAPTGPLTSEMLDEAIEIKLEESDQIDWKRAAPAEGNLKDSDLVKDIAAFANSGGGMVVFGVAEKEGRATGRVDVGEVTETFIRTLRRVAISGIQPPVFGLDVVRLGDDGARALAVVVPASLDVPHLIYKNAYFGAPIRNHADTEWMKERQLEALYRSRFQNRQNSDQALDALYEEQAAHQGLDPRAWIYLVAQPRIPVPTRLGRDEVQALVRAAERRALTWAPQGGWIHPLLSVDRLNPRRGLRRWTLTNEATGTSSWREAWAAVHDSGAVSMRHALGGQRIGGPDVDSLGSTEVRSHNIEACVADFMALLRSAATALEVRTEYDVVLGIEWNNRGADQLWIETTDSYGYRNKDSSIPLSRYSRVEATVRLDVDDNVFRDQVAVLAQDAINQGGVQNLRVIEDPSVV